MRLDYQILLKSPSSLNLLTGSALLLLVFRCHRQNAEERFKELFSETEKLVESLIYVFHGSGYVKHFLRIVTHQH